MTLLTFASLLSLAVVVSARSYYVNKEWKQPSSSCTPKTTAPEAIRKNGYPAETHHVITEDGYILALHRIPHGKRSRRIGRPVFLQHGLLASSYTWILNIPSKALAYILADKGYDVWMGNVRGNLYSKNHTCLSVTSEEFWNFSFDEMGYYDIPASIDYVLKKTGYKKLYYVGHSMGTTIFWVCMIRRPLYNSKIKKMYALAPVATVSYIKSPIKYLSYIAGPVHYILDKLGRYEFLPSNSYVMKLMSYMCTIMTFAEYVCEDSLFFLIGFDHNQFNTTMMPEIMDHLNGGTSTKTVVHFAEEYRSQKFQMYDYGWFQNWRRYDHWHPPQYDLSHVTAPVNLLWGENDWLADPQDVSILAQQLPNVVVNQKIKDEDFNHLDFVLGIDANVLVYKYIWSDMERP